MEDQKNKKKTLTISTNITKKIDLSSLSSDGKKTFSIEKKILLDLQETIKLTLDLIHSKNQLL